MFLKTKKHWLSTSGQQKVTDCYLKPGEQGLVYDQYKLIDDEEAWLSMLDDRSMSSHVYNQEAEREIFHHIKDQRLIHIYTTRIIFFLKFY